MFSLSVKDTREMEIKRSTKKDSTADCLFCHTVPTLEGMQMLLHS